MRKIIITLSLILASITAFAQYSIGIKAGYNTSLGFDQDWNFDRSTINMKNDIANGFHVGIFARIGKALYVQPEVLYDFSMYNMEFENEDLPSSNYTKKIKTHTIDIPVLLGYHLVNTKMFKFRVMAGPKMSFNVGSTKLESYNDVLAVAHPYRIGLDAGIGIDVWLLSLDLRYNLMPNKYNYIDKNTDQAIKTNVNNSFAISLGFRIQGNN